MEIPIPRDIREYEPKLIGAFTTRQCIGIGTAAVGAYGMYLLATSVMGLSAESFAFTLMCFCGCAPGAVYGFVKPYGMPIEKYIKTALTETFISPRYRKYELPDLFPDEEEDELNNAEDAESAEAAETSTKDKGKKDKGKKDKKKKPEKQKTVKAKDIPPELVAYK